MEVDMGLFDYAKHFPESKRALRHSRNPGQHITIKQALTQFLREIERRKAPSTIRDYGFRVHRHLIPTFGHMALNELVADDVRVWQDEVIEYLSAKSINNILIPLRQVFRRAFEDEKIDSNPLSRIPNLSFRVRDPKPFSKSEVNAILNGFSNDAVEVRNYFQFAFYTGLRTSELIALTWEDINWDKKQASVSKALVVGHIKAPKTNAGNRCVDLSEQAIRALRRQERLHSTEGNIFRDPRDGMPWKNDQALRKIYWYPNLDQLGIERRNPYQTRHTFASRLLSDGENAMYVASQMGHANCSMIFNVYGRWIT